MMEKTKQGVHDHSHQMQAGGDSKITAIRVLMIEDANCASCVSKIESALKLVDGVEDATMNFVQSAVTVTGGASVESLVQAIDRAGCSAKTVKRAA